MVKNQYIGIYICYEQTPEIITENKKWIYQINVHCRNQGMSGDNKSGKVCIQHRVRVDTDIHKTTHNGGKMNGGGSGSGGDDGRFHRRSKIYNTSCYIHICLYSPDCTSILNAESCYTACNTWHTWHMINEAGKVKSLPNYIKLPYVFFPACYSECTKLFPTVLMKKSIIWSRTLWVLWSLDLKMATVLLQPPKLLCPSCSCCQLLTFTPNFIKIHQQFLRQNMIIRHTESHQYVLFYAYHENNL